MAKTRSRGDQLLAAVGRGKKGKTKAELAATLGVGPSYINRIVNAGVASGTLVENITPANGRGRPPKRYARANVAA